MEHLLNVCVQTFLNAKYVLTRSHVLSQDSSSQLYFLIHLNSARILRGGLLDRTLLLSLRPSTCYETVHRTVSPKPGQAGFGATC